MDSLLLGAAGGERYRHEVFINSQQLSQDFICIRRTVSLKRSTALPDTCASRNGSEKTSVTRMTYSDASVSQMRPQKNSTVAFGRLCVGSVVHNLISENRRFFFGVGG